MALTRALVGSSSSLRAALPVPPPLRALVSVRHLLSGSLERLGGPSWRHGARQAVMATAQQRPTAAAAVAAEAAAAAERRQQHHPPNATWEHPHAGIELVVGPMFAGKSTELLRRVAGYEAQGLSVAVVKSSRDDRYCSASVATHDGLKRPCFAAPTLAVFREEVGAAYSGFHVIAVDEAQFFPDLAEFCTQAADEEHKRVVVAGLDGDFQRRRFGQVLDLLPLADSVTKLTACCKFCTQAGRRVPASFSLRISADQRQEVVGGADTYAPVCRKHYVQLSDVRRHGAASSSDASVEASSSEEEEVA